MKVEAARAHFDEEDARLFGQIFGLRWYDSLTYHLALCQCRAEAGYPKDKERWTKFLAAKATVRLTA